MNHILYSVCYMCWEQEEMARLQEDIEKLKTASGQDNEEEKV